MLGGVTITALLIVTLVAVFRTVALCVRARYEGRDRT